MPRLHYETDWSRDLTIEEARAFTSMARRLTQLALMGSASTQTTARSRSPRISKSGSRQRSHRRLSRVGQSSGRRRR